MDAIVSWLENTYGRLQDDYDTIVPVVGDEGVGKSTLILELGYLWLDVTGREQEVGHVIDEQMAWDYDQFKTGLGERPHYSCHMVHDAARVMSRKKAMHADQVELEEDLFDVRFGNYLILLGYQDFQSVPTLLADRRAYNCLVVPERGIVHGHPRSNIEHRYEEGEWPEPAFRDTFPDLEGTELWREFRDEDQERKRDRIKNAGEEDDRMTVDEVVEAIEEDGLEKIVSLHGGHGEPYIDTDMVEYHYNCSGRKARQATKVLRKKHDVLEVA